MGKSIALCFLALLLLRGGRMLEPNFQLQPLSTRVRIYGIIQDEMAQGVVGGVIFVEHEYRGSWYLVENCTHPDMKSHAWGCYVSAAGKYKVSWERYGWVVVSEKQSEFTLPDNPPKGDIVFVVRRVEPTATPKYTVTPIMPTITPTIMPNNTPIVLLTATSSPEPTSTATPEGENRIYYSVVSWFGPLLYRGVIVPGSTPYTDGFLQLSPEMQRRIIKAARTMQGEAKQPLDEMELDPLWLAAAEQGLGAQLTPGFDYRGYRVMGFSQSIVVIEKGD